MGSDGVWDNLYDEMVLERVREVLKEKKGVKRGEVDVDGLARGIAETSFRYSQMTNYESPFEAGAKQSGKRGYADHRGGKADDITVLVGQIILQQ